MPYTLICFDKPGAIEIRKANRDAHLAYIAETGTVEQAGPFLDPEGQMIGSLVILTVETEAEAADWAAGDPYAAAGLFDSVQILPWKRVVG
ncbi:YciI family protein [Mangrovicoccus algicola]|uniref:YciI family protein n=1 Tax=Mangrovicoccus algicola TaxID=2771008 RepID=A0A8J6YYF7_9RHOB|nr:YciI family protein [Mangrovicoccus algicola]MBE3638914.1 YciI family protein [Mangrovicoccus algicola]